MDDEISGLIGRTNQHSARAGRSPSGAWSGLRTTSTIMLDKSNCPNWARHGMVLRDLQAETGGYHRFVPLPVVHRKRECCYLRVGMARKGRRYARLCDDASPGCVLNPLITNIQTSWVKMGPKGAASCPERRRQRQGRHANERKPFPRAGTEHGQEFPARGDGGIRSGRCCESRLQRDHACIGRWGTAERWGGSHSCARTGAVVQTPPRKRMAAGSASFGQRRPPRTPAQDTRFARDLELRMRPSDSERKKESGSRGDSRMKLQPRRRRIGGRNR